LRLGLRHPLDGALKKSGLILTENHSIAHFRRATVYSELFGAAVDRHPSKGTNALENRHTPEREL
jgi:hypothetical protein